MFQVSNKLLLLRPVIFGKNLDKSLNLVSVRLCVSYVDTEKHKQNSKEREIKIAKNDSVKALEHLLNVRTFVANDIVSRYNKLCKVSSSTIKTNYELCTASGIIRDALLKHPEILSVADLQEKIDKLRMLPYDINDVAALILLRLNKLMFLVCAQIEENRIQILTELLNRSLQDICQVITKRPFLVELPLQHIEANVKTLTDFGITASDIMKDVWVLKYSQKTITGRLELARINNVDIKTWMVRAQPLIFETYVKRRSDNKSILGNNSLAEYLSERLDCTEEVVKQLISKHPALKNKSLTKIQEIIDFLYTQGFKPFHICRVPKILLHSVETTRQRLKELESQGMHLDSLYILTKSKKQYMQFYETLVKTKTNKKKLKTKC